MLRSWGPLWEEYLIMHTKQNHIDQYNILKEDFDQDILKDWLL